MGREGCLHRRWLHSQLVRTLGLLEVECPPIKETERDLRKLTARVGWLGRRCPELKVLCR